MPSLRDTQAAFREALLGGDPRPAIEMIVADGIAADARLAVYRHHVTTTLTAALEAVYPVVCRLVDERFFGYAADRFIAAHPPSSSCLFEFGASFPAFLRDFPPCRDLVYLADVARLEWALHHAVHAVDAAPLDTRVLAGLGPDEVGALCFRLHPSVALLDSAWPIHRIWRAHQPGSDRGTVVDLDSGGVCLEIRREGDDALFVERPPADYALRRALHEGRPLADAAAAALLADPAFDLPAALGGLFRDDILVAFTLRTAREVSV